MREIYLKPFEMAIKEGGSLGVMSSFNYIGTEWAGSNSTLLTDLLRDEWGFEGPWSSPTPTSTPYMDTIAMSYAGGDLSLDAVGAWAPFDSHAGQLLDAAKNPDTQIGMTRNLFRASKNILYARLPDLGGGVIPLRIHAKARPHIWGRAFLSLIPYTRTVPGPTRPRR